MKGLCVLLLVWVIILIICAPLFTIAALNTLFGLGIPYTFWTWLSACWLSAIVYGSIQSK